MSHTHLQHSACQQQGPQLGLNLRHDSRRSGKRRRTSILFGKLDTGIHVGETRSPPRPPEPIEMPEIIPEYNSPPHISPSIPAAPEIISVPPSIEPQKEGPPSIIRFVHNVSARMNHRISCLLSSTSCTHQLYTAVLDTGAGPNIIRRDQLPTGSESRLISTNSASTVIRDANGRELHVLEHLRLSCRVGNHTTEVPFLVLEHLAVPFILGCDYIDDHARNLQPGVDCLTLTDV
jgi:Retroviral aspartyl protease